MGLVDSGQVRIDRFGSILSDYAPVWGAWLSWIEPGGFIVLHRDAGPYRERWQVPISTAGIGPAGPCRDGVPFRVDQWEPHSVTNDTGRPRIHLVIDRDVVANPDPLPFTVYQEPPHG